MPYVKSQAKRLYLPSTATAWEAVVTDGKSERRPSAGEFWVEMRDRVRWGDRLDAQSASITRYLKTDAELTPDDWNHVVDRSDDGRCLIFRQDMQTYNRHLLAGAILSWNLTGEDEQALPITADSLKLLDDEDGDFLLAEVQARIGRAKDDEAPFDQRSPEPSQANGSITQGPWRPSTASSSANSGAAAPLS